jgi:asparagine synthase (glutamine-hydrolysing)
MQSASNRPVRTFTVSFQESACDEADHARAVARHLGTDHAELTLESAAVLDLVANVADWFDEPFADSSQLPTYLVARTTRKYVTVALSGDGGDELFGGYPKYALFDRIWRYASALPRLLRARCGRLVAGLPESMLRAIASAAVESGRAERIGEKARRLGLALGTANADQDAQTIAAVGAGVEHLVRGTTNPRSGQPINVGAAPDFMSRMQLWDMMSYLPDDIMTKVDRCSMAVSLKAREPLLDHRLIEFVWSLPLDIRRGNGEPKSLLRTVLERHVPRALTDRPNRGFSIPLGDWLAGPLRDWAESLLEPAKLASEGLFDAAGVQTLWKRHLSGVESNPTGLWNILMVRAWAERWLAAVP